MTQLLDESSSLLLLQPPMPAKVENEDHSSTKSSSTPTNEISKITNDKNNAIEMIDNLIEIELGHKEGPKKIDSKGIFCYYLISK